jgi:hypothetical protein
LQIYEVEVDLAFARHCPFRNEEFCGVCNAAGDEWLVHSPPAGEYRNGFLEPAGNLAASN